MTASKDWAENFIEDFSLFDDWEDRYRYIIDLGRKAPNLSPAEKIEANRVQGCTSQVWLVCTFSADTPPLLHFRADSDADIVRGLAAMLVAIFSGKSAQEIIDFDVQGLLSRLDLARHLSSNRANGLASLVARMRALAGRVT